MGLQEKIERMQSLLLSLRPLVTRFIESEVKENFGYCNDTAHKYLEILDKIDMEIKGE